MNQPIVYAIVAMVCYGVSDFIYKQAAAAGIRADHFLMAQGWLFCPLVIVYALATHTLSLNSAALWGSLAGAFVFIGFYFFIRSLTAGSVSTNASIFRLNFIVTVLLVVIWLGEPLTGSKIAGLALALEKFGSGNFTLAQIVKPAIDLAGDGFLVADDTADTLSDMYRRMARWPSQAKSFSRSLLSWEPARWLWRSSPTHRVR